MECEICKNIYDDSAEYCPECGMPNPAFKKELIEQSVEDIPIDTIPDDITLCCPNCKSRQIVPFKKGFSTGKALAGGLAFGVMGMLAGNIGASDEVFICQNCREKFPLNKAYIYKGQEHALNLERKVVELMKQGNKNEAQRLYIKETNANMMNTMRYFVAIYQKYGIK